MNLFDVSLVIILFVCAFTGIRVGLIKASFSAAAAILGWLIAAQYSSDIAKLFGDSLSSHTAFTVIFYSLIVITAVAISPKITKIVKPLLAFLTLGISSMVDRLGGLLLGAVMGIAICSTIILGISRVTYNFEVSDLTKNIPNLGQTNSQIYKVVDVGGNIINVEDAREGMETILSESKIVSIFTEITTSLPNNALGFVPTDFSVALEILDEISD